MKPRTLFFVTATLSCLLLVLAACGGSSAPADSTAPGNTSASTGPQTIKIPIGDFDVRAPQTTFVTGVAYTLSSPMSGNITTIF